MIFGLALSIGAIALVSSPPATDLALYRDILTFSFNFVILISAWLRYTRIMSVLPVETGRTMLMNIILLFAVSMEPFLFNILRSGNSVSPSSDLLIETASSLYGMDLGVMTLVMGVFTFALASEERKLVPSDMIRHLRSEATTLTISAGIFLASAIPVFGRISIGDVRVTGLSLRELLWLGGAVGVLLSRRILSTEEAGRERIA